MENEKNEQEQPPAQEKASTTAESPPPRETAPETGPLTQILLKVPPRIKEKAQAQADLAFKYGWIKSATLTQLFQWETDQLLDESIKYYIAQRRKSAAEQAAPKA